ncbi:MAG: hypothetical protein ACRD2P_13920 [Terriglobia bacterium]
MRKITQKLCFVTTIALLCFGLAPHAFADQVSMTLTSAGNNILGGVYVGPYTVSVNGVSEQVICDDFSDETYIGETWNAVTSTYPTLSNVAFAKGQPNQALLYDEAAWLAQNLYSSTDPTTAGEIQFAIWQIFDPTPTSGLNPFQTLESYDGSSILAGAQSWLSEAQSQTFTSGEFSNFLVYTPTPSTPPQEFLYSASEPPFALIIVANLLLFGFAFEFLRRRGVLVVSQ